MAHPQHQEVRARYGFRCGYCGVTEIDAGGELTVDHFRPTSAGGDNSEANLVYACVRCSQYKGALHSAATDSTQERRLLHPLQDHIAAHIREDITTSRLEGLTPTGNFHIEALHLNRAALIANRQRRQLIILLQARSDQALAGSAYLEERLAQRELYITYLESRLNDPSENEEVG